MRHVVDSPLWSSIETVIRKILSPIFTTPQKNPNRESISKSGAHSLLGFGRVVHRDFLPKGCTINSECTSRHGRQLWRLKYFQSHHPIFSLQHDNMQPTIAVIEWLGLHIILHISYSLDLALSDYYQFHHLKKASKGSVLRAGWWIEGNCIIFFFSFTVGILWNWHSKTYIALVVLYWITWRLRWNKTF